VSGKSNSVARAVAADILGEEVFWDWDGWFYSPFVEIIDIEVAS
jgi:hypothetical protein